MIEKLSVTFERQVERIHQLLERSPSKVVWNDKIPDPDNPDQPRQIDISIDRDGERVHVECRIHSSPQDVKWIEELIGRRASLRIDVMIAVSSSGFTDGAQKKAAAFDIKLRTLSKLTDNEVLLWVDPAKAWLVFYEFADCQLLIEMDCAALPEPIALTKEDGTAVEWRPLFETIMKMLDDSPELDHEERAFGLDIQSAPILVGGQKPSGMTFRARTRRLKKSVRLTSILQYADPHSKDGTSVYVQKHADDTVEIIRSADQAALVSDSTSAAVPPNSLFHSVLLDFIEPTSVNWVKVVNPQLAMQFDVQIGLIITFCR
ncbi:hypothetical protein XH87_23835 [Bradyrhizobium sp. CCBAU 53415]|nr:hypothetical protein [Bradyrhizobium sp. CCBAU 53415]